MTASARAKAFAAADAGDRNVVAAKKKKQSMFGSFFGSTSGKDRTQELVALFDSSTVNFQRAELFGKFSAVSHAVKGADNQGDNAAAAKGKMSETMNAVSQARQKLVGWSCDL